MVLLNEQLDGCHAFNNACLYNMYQLRAYLKKKNNNTPKPFSAIGVMMRTYRYSDNYYSSQIIRYFFNEKYLHIAYNTI